MTVSHFSVFLNIQICTVFGPDKLSERVWIGSLARRVDCFDKMPALIIYRGNLCFAVQRNRVLTSMELSSITVPLIFKHNDDVPEKKPRKSKAAEKLASKMVNSSIRRVSQ